MYIVYIYIYINTLFIVSYLIIQIEAREKETLKGESTHVETHVHASQTLLYFSPSYQ